jgi:NADH-quinone oxidoreductase subunit N
MIISLFYYLRVVRAVFIDKNNQPIEKLTIQLPVKLALFVCSVSIVLLGIMGWIFDYIESLH